jgi:hypothetical protein
MVAWTGVLVLYKKARKRLHLKAQFDLKQISLHTASSVLPSVILPITSLKLTRITRRCQTLEAGTWLVKLLKPEYHPVQRVQRPIKQQFIRTSATNGSPPSASIL